MNQSDWTHEILNHLDPALIEQAEPRAKRALPRAGRIALIAACLCAALVGGAFAATQIAGFHAIELFENLLHQNKSYDGYSLSGGCRFVPLDELSPQIRELSRQNPASTIELSAHDLREFESLTGSDLPDLSLPEDLSQSLFTAYLTSDSEGPTALACTAEYHSSTEDSLRLFVSATVYTERMEDPEFDLSVSYVFPSGYEFSSQRYVTDSGLEVLLTHSRRPATDVFFNLFGSDSYYADFTLSGVRYHLVAYCPNTPDYALSTMQTVLENFHS